MGDLLQQGIVAYEVGKQREFINKKLESFRRNLCAQNFSRNIFFVL
jgi:hypothetical protein